MSASNVPLIQALPIAATNTLVFTATAKTRLDAVTLYNPIGNAACLVTLSIVTAGGSPGTPNQITSHNCLAGETYLVFGMIGQSLGVGDMIYAQAATASLVNLFASGLITS